MRPGARRRGEPLLVLAGILLCWIGARAAIWEAPLALRAHGMAYQRLADVVRPHRVAAAERDGPVMAGPVRSPASPPQWSFAAPASSAPPRTVAALPPVAASGPPVAPIQYAPPPVQPVPVRVVSGHALLWMAAVGNVPMPEVVMARLAAQAAPVRQASRWSADGWLLLRRDGGLAATGSAFPRYGANQLGAVLRYRLDHASGHRPAAYLRASAALGGQGERELAAGLAARPVAGLPVTLAAELRVSRMASGTLVRPAAFAVTELPPFDLPLGTRGEAYVQAGYVGGPAATGFADGQLRVDRELALLGKAQVRAGAGIWGGAQKGSSRLDIGPSATIGLSNGAAGARLGLDWRFRVAGNAAPASGPALTLSAGF